MASLRAALQARRSPGFRGGGLRITGGLEFWTLTVWTDGRHMAAYRDAGFHGRVMPDIRVWASEAAFAVWQAETADVPSWPQIRQTFAERASFAELDRPSTDHVAHRVRPSIRRGLSLPLRRPRRNERRTTANVV